MFKWLSDFFYDIRVWFSQKFKRKEKVATTYTAEELKRQKRMSNVKQWLCIWSILIIPIIDLLVFWVYGTLQSIPIAFEHKQGDGSIVYDFWNFEFLFEQITLPDSYFLEAFLNTLKYFAWGFLFLTPLSIIMGYFLYKKIKGYKFFRYVFFFPSIISGVILSSFFKEMFSDIGQVNYLLENVFGKEAISFFYDSDYTFGTTLLYSFWFGLCGNLLYWLAAYNRIPDELIEAGKIDGTNSITEFVYLIIPIVGPFVATMMMLMLTGIFNAGGNALLLTGGGYGTMDLGFYEYLLTTGSSSNVQVEGNAGLGGAIGLLKGVVILPIALTVNYFVGKIETVDF